MESQAREVALIGGYGSGKTVGGGDAAAVLALDNAGLEGMIVAPSYKMLIRVTLPAFLAACGPLVKEYHKADSRIELWNGSIVWLGTTDSPGSLEGSTLAWAWLDEARLAEWEAYRILIGRIRDPRAVRPQLVVTSTPAAGTWLEDVFGGGRAGVETIHTSSKANKFLSKEYIDSLLSKYSAAEAAAYVDGLWMHVGEGRVFPEFDQARHVIDYQPDPELPVMGGMDFGYRWPAAVFFQQMKNDRQCGNTLVKAGSVVVFGEDTPDGISTEGMGYRIAQRFPPGEKPRLLWLGVDPAGSSFSSAAAEHRGLTDVQALRAALTDNGLDCGLRYLRAKGAQHLRSVNTGLEQVRGRLLNAKGETRLYFARSLVSATAKRGIIRSLSNMLWRNDDLKPLRGDKGQQLDHVADALRYGLRHLELQGPATMMVA